MINSESNKFQIHHILPVEIFNDPFILEQLEEVFGQDYLKLRDSKANKIGLFTDAEQAQKVALALQSGDTFYQDIGMGGSQHNGSHPAYNKFIQYELTLILTAPESALTNEQKKIAVFDLMRFATDISRGTATYDGQTLTIKNPAGQSTADYTEVFKNVWESRRLDPTTDDALTQNDLANFITDFESINNIVTDDGKDGLVNVEQRLAITQKYTEALHQQGVISDAVFDERIALLDQATLAPDSSGTVSSIFFKNSYDQNVAEGGTQTARDTLQYFVGTEEINGQAYTITVDTTQGPSPISTPGYTAIAGELDLVSAQLPDAFSALSESIRDSLSKSLIGVGGGVVGDTGEFLNHSYDSLKHGLDTGDWQPMFDDIEAYGEGLVLSTFMVLGTTALAGVAFGPGGAAAVAAGWAAYGIYDGLTNLAELIGKVVEDIPYWLDHLSDAFQALLKDELDHSGNVVSPLILDLDGDGVETIALDDGVYFDHDNNGFEEKSGWVGKDDGLLVWDKDHDGKISNGSELFGNNSILADGTQASNGFSALNNIDENADGAINADDAKFSELRVWQDANADGDVQAGELTTLDSANVKALNVAYETSSKIDEEGNQHQQVGQYVKKDGSTAAMTDVWFQANLMDTQASQTVDIGEDIAARPNIAGFGNVHNLHQAMALDETGKLASLIDRFSQSENFAERQALVDSILFTWTGSDQYEADSRGRYFSDARKLYALESFIGETFVQGSGTNGGLIDPGPNAAKLLSVAYDKLADQVYSSLSLQTHYAGWLEGVSVDITSGKWTLDASSLISRLAQNYDADKLKGTSQALDFASALHLAAIPLTDDLLKTLHEQGANYEGDFGALLSNLGKVTVGNDSVYGTSGNDTLNGFAGDDSLYGGDGADTLDGDEGNDRLEGDSGDDTLRGGAGEDDLYGGDGADTLLGGDGEDRLYGGSGDDTLEGNAGDDYLKGKDGNDTLRGGAGADILYGDAGNDIIDGGNGADTLYGGLGADTFRFGAGYGHDTISSSDSVDNRLDTVDLFDLQSADIVVQRDDTDLILTVSNSDDRLTVKYFFETDSSVSTVKSLRFADGTEWSLADIKARVLVSTDGDDRLYGYATADALDGGRGDDWLSGVGGADTLDGNSGADSLYGGDGADTLDGGLGDDLLSGGSDDDAVSAGSGDDSLYGGDGADTLDGGEGNDRVDGDAGNDMLQAGAGEDRLYGDSGSDTLEGGYGNDVLHGGSGDDVLEGDYGNDDLYGDSGDDILAGGAGNDYLKGEDGSDTYRFVRGWGSDRVYNYARNDAQAIDTIVFADDIAPNDIDVTRSGDDLILALRGTNDWVEVDYYFQNDGVSDHRIEAIRFADGTEWVLDDIKARVLVSTDGNDRLYGYATADNLNGGRGDDRLEGNAGNDALSGSGGSDNLYGGDGADTLDGGEGGDRLDGDAGNDTLQGGAGEDSLYGASGDDALEGGYGNDDLQGGSGNDILKGGYGNDTLYGDSGDDILDGSAGNDYLRGEEGNDTYRFARGWGADRIYNYARSDAQATDAIVFADDIAPDDIVTTRSGDDLILSLRGTNDRIEVDYFFQNDGVSSHTLETIRFVDGTEWSLDDIKARVLVSTQGNDQLYGDAKVDTLDGGQGDDWLSGAGGDDKLSGSDGADSLYGGDGADIVDGGAGSDRVDGGAGNDMLKGGYGNDDLYGDSGDDTLEGGYGNDDLQGGSGDDMLTGGVGDDYLRGEEGSDTYRFARGWGSDRIYNYARSDALATDNIIFADDIAPDDIVATRNGDDLILALRGTDDRIEIDYYFQNDGVSDHRIEAIHFADTTEWSLADVKARVLISTEGNDRLYGYATVDTLNGSEGNDRLEGGDGNDTLRGGVGEDKLYGDSGDDFLEGGVGEDSLYGGGNDDTLEGDAENDSLYGNSGNDNLEGDAGNDTLYGDSGNDILEGGIGNDYLRGEEGSDTYRFARGWGSDRIYNYASSDTQATDAIVFADGIAPDDIVATRSGDDLILTLRGTKDRIEIDYYFQNDGVSGHALEAIRFAEGTEWLLADVKARVLVGMNNDDWLNLVGDDGNDKFLGGTGDDRLYGNGGDDILEGGVGDDFLIGEYGSDTYHFARGWGSDRIYDYARGDTQATDVIVFADDIAPGDIITTRSGDDLILTLRGTDDRIEIDHYFQNDGMNDRRIEAIRFVDGTEWSLEEIKARVLVSTEGNDRLYGYATDDTLDGGLRDDDLYGEGGADILDGGEGNDWLEGGNGNDTLQGGAGYDTLYGDAGNDTLDGGGGADTLYGGLGADTFRFGAGYGHDTISSRDSVDNRLDTVDLFDLSPADVVVQRDDTDLILITSYGDDQLTVKYFFETGSSISTIKAIRFADGTEWSLDDIKPRALISTQGNDRLYGYATADTLDGGQGADWLSGAVGDDALSGSSGADSLYGGDGADALDGGQGSDWLSANGGDDTLFGGGGADSLYGGDGADILDGYAGDDRVDGDAGDDTLQGGAGEDRLYGDSGSDALEGGYGNDDLYGDSGDDILAGGAGDDYLKGEDGSDTYRFARGWGADRIYNYARGDTQAIDAIVFADDIAPDDIVTTRNGDDLTLVLRGTNDWVEVDYYFQNDGVSDHRIEAIRFANGTEWSLDDVKARVLTSTDGNDRLYGYATADNLNGGRGDDRLEGNAGNDALSGSGGSDNLYGGDGADTLDGGEGGDRLDGDAGNDTLQGGAGEDSLYGASGDDALEGGYGNDDLQGGSGNDILKGGYGNDTLYGDSGDDILDGSAGNDYLRGEEGSDTYRFARGWGSDRIYNYARSDAQATDAIVFADGIAPDDIVTTRSGDDLILSLRGTNDRIEVDYFFQNDGVSSHTLETIRFVDGTEWSLDDIKARVLVSTDGEDYLYGYATVDVLDGGRGDDWLSGADGDDSLFGGGGGDSLYGGDGADTLDGGLGDDWLSANSGDDALSGSGGADSLYGGDGADVLDGGEGNDRLDGDAGNDTLQGGTGKDRLYGDNGDDSLEGGYGNDSLYGNSGDDKLHGGAGDDTLHGGDGTDVLEGGAGSDFMSVSTDAQNSIFSGGLGDDTLHLSSNSNTIVFNIGDGKDTVVLPKNINNDGDSIGIVSLGEGIDVEDLWLRMEGTDLTLHIGDQGDALEVQDIFDSSNPDDAINNAMVFDEINFSDGSSIAWESLVYEGFQAEPLS